MDLPMLKPQELSELVEQVEPTEQAGHHGGADLVPSPEEPTRYSDLSVQHQELTSTEPEEVLVADARGGLTPGQMVEQKVLALMGSNYPGLFSQGIGRRGIFQRNFGK